MNDSSAYGNASQYSGNMYQGGSQQHAQAGGFGNFANFMPNDPNMNMTAQMGMHFGQQMVLGKLASS